MIMASITTTTVDPMVCFLEGHVTFLSSTLTSLRNWRLLSIMFGYFLPLAALTGLEGFLIGTSFLTLDPVSAIFFAAPAPGVPAPADFAEDMFFAAVDDAFFWLAGFFRFNRPIGLLKS